jgi:hypothetical protein
MEDSLTFEEKVELIAMAEKEYRKTLYFVSDYVDVPFCDTLNYSERLTYSSYLKVKEDWNLWYAENKCNNIQLKTK